MEKVIYDKEITALLVIDPYNDFISEGGKVWDRLKAVAAVLYLERRTALVEHIVLFRWTEVASAGTRG